MRSKEFYQEQASIAYENYRRCQDRIVQYEKAARDRYPAGAAGDGLAVQFLKRSDEMYVYRDLVSDRGMYMELARLNAAMAAIAPAHVTDLRPGGLR